nr:maltose permease mal31 [Quercus suber]
MADMQGGGAAKTGANDLAYGTFGELSTGSSKMKPTGRSVLRDVDDERSEGSSAVVNKGDVGDAGDDQVRRAAELEHDLGFWQALRRYPTAAGWSVFFSLGVIMTAFDPQLLGAWEMDVSDWSEYGKPNRSAGRGVFRGVPYGVVWTQEDFWYVGPPSKCRVKSAYFESAVCVVLTTAFIFIQFFARSLPILLIGEIFGGLVLGTYATIAPTYASEVCPVALRGLLTSFTNLCFVIGQLIANGVIAGTSTLDSHWAYSAPFAAQWIWPLVILAGMPWAPESPWWLVRKDRIEDAERSLRRLASTAVDVKPTLAMIIETDQLEQEMQAGTTYLDCLRPINLRRTEIGIGVYCIQVLSGIYLVGYATYFFELAGLPTSKAFDMSIGFLALGFIGTCASWWAQAYFGRRTIYISGLAALMLILMLIGILDCVPGYETTPAVIWTQSSLMLVWNFVYDFSVGPVCFVILCEVSATKVRSKTIAIATASQALLAIGMTTAIPYMINPDQANMRGKIGFFYGGLSALCLLWAFFRVPETKGRTFEELDLMFVRKVSTRAFARYIVE